MSTPRENNKEKQLAIINKLITSKTEQIAEYLGNLSLDDAKYIIETGYLDTKNGINSLNSQITDTQQLINNHKQKIKNLQMEKESLLHKEKTILDAELLRIANKKDEQLQKLKQAIQAKEEELHILLDKERELEHTIKKGGKFIKTFKYNRAKLRLLHVNQINQKHIEHKQRLNVKRELELQLVNLNSHITELQKKINKYDISRHAINQDYYNWKKDNKLCEEIINSLEKELTHIINNSLQTNQYGIDEVEIDINNTMLDINDLIIYSLNQCGLPISSIKNEALNTTKLVPTLLSILELQKNMVPFNEKKKITDILSKLNRYQQTLVLYENLKEDTRQNMSERYAKLKIERKKDIKRLGKIQKFKAKFQTELDKTHIFKKEKIIVPELNNDEKEYNETQSLINKSKIELEHINADLANVQNALTILEDELTTLNTEELPETLLNDKLRCLSRWEKVQLRCENKYDTECNNIAETIQLKFKLISTLQKQLKETEQYWTNINNNPGLILEKYHKNLNINNLTKDNLTSEVLTIENNNINTQIQDIVNIKDEIADIINMKRAISRIQSNR